MARSPAPPGPPPPNWRPPGAPGTPPPPLLGRPADGGTATARGHNGASAGAVAAVAVITLLLGLVIGFFLGRATEADDTPSAAPPLTSPSTSTTRPPGDTIPQNTPVDPSAPPSTDLEPNDVGSVDDPIPVGQAYVLGLYEIAVRSVDRDADETLATHDRLNPSAPPGRSHLIVEVQVRYTDDSGFGNPGAIPFFVSDGDDRWNDIEAQCGFVPDSLLDSTLLESGQEAVGNTCFTVPSDALGSLMFGTEGVNGPLYFELPD